MNAETNNDVSRLFLEFSINKLDQMQKFVDSCLRRLSDEQIWRRDGAYENAVGNLILHLCGNMRQWIMYGVDRQPDVRVRDAEFSADGGLSRDELLARFGATILEVKRILSALEPEGL